MYYRMLILSLMLGAAAAPASGQVSGQGQYISSDKSTDSGSASHYTDDPQDHLHQQTTPIGNGSGNDQQTDNTSVQQSADSSSAGMSDTGEGENDGKGTNTRTLLYAAIGVFGLGALIGLYILSTLFKNEKPNRVATGLHGALAVTGLGLLIAYACKYSPGPIAAITFFSLAALGGFFTLYLDLNKKQIPRPLPLMHGALALIGYILLLVFTFA
ncbi:MAG: hypothetical protein U0V74_04255 [Chitinophagales bacterium]